MLGLATVLLLLQGPGGGLAVSDVPPRFVKTVYWELYDTTETWVSLIPADASGGQPLVRLVCHAFWPGRTPKGPPGRIVVRALDLPVVMVTAYSLDLTVDQQTERRGSKCMKADGAGPPCQLQYPLGQNASANGVAVDVDIALLERMARAHSVTGTALGFQIQLAKEDVHALGELVAQIHGHE